VNSSSFLGESKGIKAPFLLGFVILEIARFFTRATSSGFLGNQL